MIILTILFSALTCAKQPTCLPGTTFTNYDAAKEQYDLAAPTNSIAIYHYESLTGISLDIEYRIRINNDRKLRCEKQIQNPTFMRILKESCLFMFQGSPPLYKCCSIE